MYTGLHVKYPLLLSGFNEIWISSTEFQKNTPISNVKEIRTLGAELFHANIPAADGRDITKLIIAFDSFANAPKNVIFMYPF